MALTQVLVEECIQVLAEEPILDQEEECIRDLVVEPIQALATGIASF